MCTIIHENEPALYTHDDNDDHDDVDNHYSTVSHTYDDNDDDATMITPTYMIIYRSR